VWSKEFKQNILRLHLNNGRHVSVLEADVNDVLEKLGLGEFVEDWVFSLEKDIS
jgi:transposase-like protein